MAAAICWESYMPLLRQALYAQNINLYLAPTADARDAWLSLMRTVGVEGRCFVVSSNMCTRAADTAGSAGSKQAVSNGTAASPNRARNGRRVSIEQDGFEIALPKTTSPSRRRRRKSVFDNDGNEIVLCCPEDDKDQAGSQTKGHASVESSKTQEKQTQQKGSWSCRGGSCIVDPFGDVLAGPQWEDDQGLIFADVDLRDCIKGRLDLDAGGSYSRNDCFRLSVNGLDMDPLPYQ